MLSKYKLIIGSLAGTFIAAAGVAFCILGGRAQLSSDEDQNGGFSGIVVNGLDGRRLKNATVTAYIRNDDGSLNAINSVTCDENGRFDIPLNDGAYLIVAANPGFTTRGRDDSGRELDVSGGVHFVNGKLRLWPVATLKGRVVNGRAGIRAQVTLEYEKDASGDGGYTFVALNANQDGDFEIPNAYAGIAVLRIAASGFASVRLTDLALAAGNTLDLGDIPLHDGVTLFGQIRDAQTNRGIRGANIQIVGSDGAVLETQQTSASGDYAFAPLDNSVQISVSISAEGYRKTRKNIDFSGKDSYELSLALKRMWGLTLDVQNRTGREPIETRIRIIDPSTEKEIYREVLSNGAHSLDFIKSGSWIVDAESGDRLTHKTFRVQAGDNVLVRLDPFARIDGDVFDSDGTPLQNGEYRYYVRSSADASEDSSTPWMAMASSRFTIEDLHEGFYRVEVRRENGEPTSSPEFQLREGDVRSLSIRLNKGGVLRGHVASAVDGLNLANATVSVVGSSQNATTDTGGNFTLDQLPSGAFSISIQPEREQEPTLFEGIVVKENTTLSRDFRVNADRTESRQRRRARFEEMRANGELPPPRGGKPPWDNNGDPPEPPPWNQNAKHPPTPNEAKPDADNAVGQFKNAGKRIIPRNANAKDGAADVSETPNSRRMRRSLPVRRSDQ